MVGSGPNFHSVLSRYRFMNVFRAETNPHSSSGTDLSCQCIKLVGKRQLAATLQQQLTFADHVHAPATTHRALVPAERFLKQGLQTGPPSG